ncbi:MAG: iron ABC transporter permease [Rhodobacteraceae bacterium]|nr:iron ABC transporter permease [Paracoccaceae bacterium]
MVDKTSQIYKSHRKARLDIWSAGSILIALLILAPLFAVVWIAFFPSENIWKHLLATTLPRYFRNSLILMVTVGLGAGIIGTGTAWLVVMKRFPLRRVLEWALLMPLAIPAYIGAYALVDFLEYAGPVQTWMRGFFGWENSQNYWFPEIRSIWFAALVLTLSLYPYVYLMSRAAFREQSANMIEVSRALGCGPWQSFFRVALPLARPAIAASLAIVMMETLNDFGTVDYFAVQTLTTGIFTVWLQGYNAGGAAQIASVILTLVLVLAVFEKLNRKKRRFHSLSARITPVTPERLRGFRALLASIACLLPFLLGFVLPLGVIGSNAMAHLDTWADPSLWRAAGNTVFLGATAALLVVLGALFMVFGARRSRLRLPRILMPLTAIGYAAPGAVLAIGLLIPLAAFDNALADFVESRLGVDIGLILTGSSAAIIFAYIVRFFAIPQGGIDAALGRVTPSMEMASRSLGRNSWQTLWSVQVPLIRGSVLVAGLLVFVDAVKELPATLILRPFNFDTLATRVYGQASLENLPAAAPAALLVTLTGLLPVILLARAGNRAFRKK